MFGFYGKLLWDTWEKTQQILSSGAVDPGPVITHRYCLEEYQTAFEQAASGEGCKILFLS